MSNRRVDVLSPISSGTAASEISNISAGHRGGLGLATNLGLPQPRDHHRGRRTQHRVTSILCAESMSRSLASFALPTNLRPSSATTMYTRLRARQGPRRHERAFGARRIARESASATEGLRTAVLRSRSWFLP